MKCILGVLCICSAFLIHAQSQPQESDTATPRKLAIPAVDQSGNLRLPGNVMARSADARRIGAAYDVLAFGADPTGATDSTAAIQDTMNAADGAPVVLPPGKYVISRPLYWYTTPGRNGWEPGLKLQGAGFGRTQLLVSPAFSVPVSSPLSGAVVTPHPAVIDLQGTVAASYYGRFQSHSEISGLEIAPEGCEVGPNPKEPACSSPRLTLAGISVEGNWEFYIHDNWISSMSGDGIAFPLRLDLGIDPDWWASAQGAIDRNHIVDNHGWGINLSADDGSTAIEIRENEINGNFTGGVRDTGWGNYIIHNSISGNGCGKALNGTEDKSVVCSTSPLGPGILVTRGPLGGAPLLGRIEGNTLDSNALVHIDFQAGSNYIIRDNFLLSHTTSYLYNNSFPGVQNVPKESIRFGSGTGSSNLLIESNQQRSDYECAAGYPKPSAGCSYPNQALDPELATINFDGLLSSSDQVTLNLIRRYNQSSNIQPYSEGAGLIAGVPEMRGGAVASWPLIDGGLGWGAA